MVEKMVGRIKKKNHNKRGKLITPIALPLSFKNLCSPFSSSRPLKNGIPGLYNPIYPIKMLIVRSWDCLVCGLNESDSMLGRKQFLLPGLSYRTETMV